MIPSVPVFILSSLVLIFMECEEIHNFNIQPAINLLEHSFQHALTNCSYGNQILLLFCYAKISSSSSSKHGVGPLDPFGYRRSKNLFNGLPWFLKIKTNSKYSVWKSVCIELLGIQWCHDLLCIIAVVPCSGIRGTYKHAQSYLFIYKCRSK